VNNYQENPIQLLQLSRLNLQTFRFANMKTYQVNNYQENPIQLLQQSQLNIPIFAIC